MQHTQYNNKNKNNTNKNNKHNIQNAKYKMPNPKCKIQIIKTNNANCKTTQNPNMQNAQSKNAKPTRQNMQTHV